MGGILKRRIEAGQDTAILGFGGRDYIQSVVFDATSLQRSGMGGTNEVQTATLTGSPSGGNFKLGVGGVLTANIAYNAAASAVEEALEALSTVGEGGVSVTGSAGGPYTVTFRNQLGNRNLPAMTKDATGLTGGTTPNVAIATTTPGKAQDNDGRYIIGTGDYPGTILTEVPGDTTKVREYTGLSGEAIIGIADGEWEFISNTVEGHRDMACYNQPGLVLDASKIHNYDTYKTAFDAWAAGRGVAVEFGD